MTLTELAKQLSKESESKGYFRQTTERGSALMKIVVELSDALKEGIKENYADIPALKKCLEDMEVPEAHRATYDKQAYQTHIKGTYEAKITDAIIQLLVVCGKQKIDIDALIDYKRTYDKI